MCKGCVDALKDVFPEVPSLEYSEFLLSCTCYPFGTVDQLRGQLLELKSLMKSIDYHECYAIADMQTESEMKKFHDQELLENAGEKK